MITIPILCVTCLLSYLLSLLAVCAESSYAKLMSPDLRISSCACMHSIEVAMGCLSCCRSRKEVYGIKIFGSCVALCYAMQRYAAMSFAMTCYVLLCRDICYAVQCFLILCCAVPCFLMLCHAMPCYTMLAMLCCAVLCYAVLSPLNQTTCSLTFAAQQLLT